MGKTNFYAKIIGKNCTVLKSPLEKNSLLKNFQLKYRLQTGTKSLSHTHIQHDVIHIIYLE